MSDTRRSSRLLSMALTAGPLMVCPTALASQVVYDNGLNSIQSSQSSDRSLGIIRADDFILSETALVGGVRFRGSLTLLIQPPGGIDSLGIVDDFRIRFYAGDTFLPFPADVLATRTPHELHRVDTGASFIGNPVYEYEAYFPPIHLDANTTYFIEISNNTNIELNPPPWDAFDGWGWTTAAFGNPRRSPSSTDDGASWELSQLDLAFQLLAVPDPASGLIVFPGILALLRRRF